MLVASDAIALGAGSAQKAGNEGLIGKSGVGWIEVFHWFAMLIYFVDS